MSEIYAPDYLRSQEDPQLHGIATMIEYLTFQLQSEREKNAELEKILANHKLYQDYDDEIKLLHEKVTKLRAALSRLEGEVRGTLSAHEVAIRYDSGNSNWECLEKALTEARSVLAEIGDEK
jgi:hypothetical protein